MCKCEEKIEHGCMNHGKEVKRNALRRALHAGLLRLLGMNRVFEQPSRAQEEISQVGVPVSNYHSNRKEIEAALLEAERRKAEAIEWQRRRFIC